MVVAVSRLYIVNTWYLLEDNGGFGDGGNVLLRIIIIMVSTSEEDDVLSRSFSNPDVFYLVPLEEEGFQ